MARTYHVDTPSYIELTSALRLAESIEDSARAKVRKARTQSPEAYSEAMEALRLAGSAKLRAERHLLDIFLQDRLSLTDIPAATLPTVQIEIQFVYRNETWEEAEARGWLQVDAPSANKVILDHIAVSRLSALQGDGYAISRVYWRTVNTDEAAEGCTIVDPMEARF